MIAETSQLLVGYARDSRGAGGSRDLRHAWDARDSRGAGGSRGGKSGE